jgi:hypothetical protein
MGLFPILRQGMVIKQQRAPANYFPQPHPEMNGVDY